MGLSDIQKREKFLLQITQDKNIKERILEWGGRLALENKNWSIAEEIFASLMERRTQPEDRIGLARALLKQNRLEEAEECLLDALQYISEPCLSLFFIYENLGKLACLNQNFELAEEYYNKAHTISPQSDNLQFQQAYLSWKMKEYKRSEELFQQLVKKNPSISKYWLGLALCRSQLQEKELALACLKKTLDLEPSNPLALNLKKSWSQAHPIKINKEFYFFCLINLP